jgi:hypothetical protein
LAEAVLVGEGIFCQPSKSHPFYGTLASWVSQRCDPSHILELLAEKTVVGHAVRPSEAKLATTTKVETITLIFVFALRHGP